MKIVIADTSCLILFDKINRFDILQKTIASTLFITNEVAEEFGELPGWISVKGIADRTLYLTLLKNLGKGEGSSIALALESNNCLLIIDEKKGRKTAEKLNIDVIGSLGVLVKAKE